MSLKLGASNTSLILEQNELESDLAASPVHDSTPKMTKANNIYELHPLPTHLLERPIQRRLSSTPAHSGISIAKRAEFIQTLKSSDNDSTILRTTTDLSTGTHTAELSPLSKQQKRYSMIQFVAFCWCFWIIGWNDGSLGPLLPRIQHDYQLGFAIVSMIFVGNCVGYVSGSALNVWFNDRYGLGKVVVAGAIIQLAGYAMIISSPPFPVIICAYLLLGFGISLQVAQGNGFVGSLRQHMTLKLGLAHGSYGLGAFIAPFSATYFATLTDRKWAFHFILSAVFSVLNTAVLIYVFRFRRREDVLRDAGQEPNVETSAQSDNTYKQILKLKAMPWLIIFAVIYIGVEVTLGGWIVTFIIRERHGGPNSGYISSGFFGGLTAGRVCLIWLNEMVGAKRIILIYGAIAIGLELTIWFVPSIIENGVAISLTGIVLGPMYPLLVSHMTHILPHWLLTGCVGLVTGLGMAGSAALPFVTGLLASKFGIGSLQPLMISMMGCMVFVWALVPSTEIRAD